MSNASPRKLPAIRWLTLIRHAKAEEDSGMLPDNLRRLNPRGEKDASTLAETLQKRQISPDYYVCSTAQRTRQTLAAITAPCEQAPEIKFSDRLYLASAPELLKFLRDMDDSVMHVAVVGHNPGLHQLAALLAGDYATSEDEERLALKFPTSATASFSLPIAHWSDLAPGIARLETFVTLK